MLHTSEKNTLLYVCILQKMKYVGYVCSRFASRMSRNTGVICRPAYRALAYPHFQSMVTIPSLF